MPDRVGFSALGSDRRLNRSENEKLDVTQLGWVPARAHAGSGDRIAIAAYLGSGDAFDTIPFRGIRAR